jgi:energy-coupling factor transporter ATP-binding protein EcfA2
MARAPAKDLELTTLRDFLSATADNPLSQVGDLARARALAARLAHRLERPLRVLVAGEPGSGKSTLTNALAGDPVLPINNMPLDMPPVFVRHGTPRTSFAGWWGEKDRRRSDTMNLRELAALVPDFIVVQGEFPRLTDINLFDIQGRQDMGTDGSPLLETAGSADMIIWCSTADDPWKVRERQVWAKLPKTLRQHSLLAITHGDEPRFVHDFPRIYERAVQEAARHFTDVVALNAPKAMAAVKNGKVTDSKSWTESGAEQIADALDLAAATIKDEIIREARAAISAPLAQFIRDAQTGGGSSRPAKAAPDILSDEPAPPPAVVAEPPPAPPPEPAPAPVAAPPAPAPLEVAPPVVTPEPVVAPPVVVPEPVEVAAPVVEPEPVVSSPEPVAEAPVVPEVAAEPEPVVELPPPPVPAAAAAAARMAPKSDAKSKAEPKPDAKAAPKAEPKPEPKAEPKAEAKPEPKVEAKPEPKAEAKPEPKVEVKAPPAPSPKKAEPAAAPKVEPAVNGAKDHPLLTGWNDKITALITQIEGADEVDSGTFLQSCCDIVMDVSNAIGEPGVLDGEANWLQSQFQDALDLLILLQIETGDEAVEDASTVLLQLARDVSWLSTRAA